MCRYPRTIARGLAAVTAGILSAALAAAAAAAQDSAPNAAPLPVTLVQAKFASVISRASLTGDIEPRESTQIAFRDGGRILSLEVTAGDHVIKGQELGQVDATQAFDRGVTTRVLLDEASEALQTLQARLKQADAQIRQSKAALDETVLRAPFDGSVIERMAEPGQIVGPATPVFELAADDGVDAVFAVPDTFLSRPIEGTEVELRMLDQPDLMMTGTVREVSPMLDPRNGSITVRVSVNNPDPSVRLGAPVAGAIGYSAGAAFALPWTVLTATAEGPAVWVVNRSDMTAHLRQVTISRHLTGRVLISEGLEEGELVVADGSHQLYPGRPVREGKAE
jgi:RND family efflux transporter MFP subunit